MLALISTLAMIPLGAFADTPVTRLGQGINSYNVHDYSATIQQLRALEPQVPRLADYIAYHLASAELQTGDIDGAVRDLATYRAHPVPSSPLAGKIALLYAHALLDKKQAASNSAALATLQADYKMLPQPDGDFALARAYEAQGEKLQAALAYVKIYYVTRIPTSRRNRGRRWIVCVRSSAKIFPSAPPSQQLERCQKWLDAREFLKAREEYTVLAGTLPEPDRDQAKVGIGVANFLAGDANGAIHYLKDLKVSRTEADARRLYYLTEAARKTGDDAGMMQPSRN